eukprot:1984323-Prymnesium_polylepis.1
MRLNSICDAGTPIGICVEGASIHKFLVLTDSATFCQPPAADIDTFSDLRCCAFEGNPLGLSAGEPFILSLTFAESPVAANLGIAITDVGAFAVHATSEASQQPAKKKARSKMELVSITDEKGYARILNHENSMRALVSWLDKYNSEFAGKYGVDKLVWCEEGSSARSSAGMVRGWFHYDVDNDMKQKPLPNANAAIECMQRFTTTDFYHDLYTKTSDFPFAKSVKGESSTSSASATIVPVSEDE